jgi:hypothetical protein
VLGAIIVFQYAVMLAAPRDVLTRFPLLRGFVGAMEWVCSFVAVKDNTITFLGRAARYPEPAQLLVSLMIAMLPLYLYCCYRWLGFDRKRNYRHFIISPYNREKVKGSTDFIKDGFSDEEQQRLGISTEAPPDEERSLVGIFIWSLLLFILPYGASLAIFGFGQSERVGVGWGTLLWMQKALLYNGGSNAVDTLLAVLGIQAEALVCSVVTAAFFCCWRDWYFFIWEKLTGD